MSPDVLNPAVFTMPTKIIFGAGTIKHLAEEVRALGISHVLLVTDAGLSAAGVAGIAQAPLRQAGLPVTVFDAVPVEPDLSAVDAGLARAVDAGCDGVVGIGGGSVLVAARAIAALMTNAPPLRQYQGYDKLPRDPAPVIAIPTTAGSGAEVSPSIPITDPEIGRRIIVRGRAIFPRVAILDPETLTTLPPRQFIASGIDAFTHAVEALVTRAANPITDALAIGAAGTMMRVLPSAALTPDVEAKGRQLLASTMAMMASGTVGLGLVHGVGNGIYALSRSGSKDRPLIPHGTLSGILLPHVMRYNQTVAAEKYAGLAREWALDGSCSAAITAVERLNAALDLPATVPWSPLSEREIEEIAAVTLGTVQARENPRQPQHDDVVDLVRRCFDHRAGGNL